MYEISGHVKHVDKNKITMPAILGHPMNLFLKMPVLQANFCWLFDVKEVIWKESVAEIKVMEVVRVDVISKKLLRCVLSIRNPQTGQ